MPGDDRVLGNVGTPLPANLVKLVDVPEMNYTANDVVNGALCPRGEVCFKEKMCSRGIILIQSRQLRHLTRTDGCTREVSFLRGAFLASAIFLPSAHLVPALISPLQLIVRSVMAAIARRGSCRLARRSHF